MTPAILSQRIDPANLAILARRLPLYEAICFLADAFGVRLRPAFYHIATHAADPTANDQAAALAINGDPLIIHEIRATPRAGVTYDLAIDRQNTPMRSSDLNLPKSLEAPLIVRRALNYTATNPLGTGISALTPIVISVAGFRAPADFARFVSSVRGVPWFAELGPFNVAGSPEATHVVTRPGDLRAIRLPAQGIDATLTVLVDDERIVMESGAIATAGNLWGASPPNRSRREQGVFASDLGIVVEQSAVSGLRLSPIPLRAGSRIHMPAQTVGSANALVGFHGVIAPDQTMWDPA